MSGCDYQKLRFSVPMGSKEKENKCWNCLNHKYNGGEGLDGKPCQDCEKNKNFREVDIGRKTNCKNN